MDPQIGIPSISDAHHSTQQSSSLDSNDGVYLNQDLESSFLESSYHTFIEIKMPNESLVSTDIETSDLSYLVTSDLSDIETSDIETIVQPQNLF